MKFIHYASAALLVIGFALAAPAAGNAASPLIAGAMTGPVQPAAGGFAGLVQKVDRLTYFDKKVIEYPRYHPRYNHHRHNQRQHHRYRHYNRNRGGDGVYFNFGGRGGGFTFGVQPSYRVYERPRYYRRDYRGSSASAHISWCYDRYRSYRQRDNSFQPYHGPRKQCISPYY